MQGEPPKSIELCLAEMDNDNLLNYLHHYMEEGSLELAFNLCLKMEKQIVVLYILGQLSSGHEAINYYNEGICMDSNKDSIITAYLAMVEIYMTDLCDEPDASQKCDKFINSCLELDSESVDTYFMIADLRLCQCENQKAKAAIETAMGLFLNDFSIDLPTPMPTYDFRIKGAKVCIELELIDSALEILKTNECEFDEDLDLLYLSSLCYLLNSDKDNCELYLSKLKTFDTEHEYVQGIQEIESKIKHI